MHPTAIRIDGISAESPLRVLYIAGCGRSGTTILDTLLGNHPKMESVGEATNIVRNAWLSDDGYCACGEPGRACPFWTEVRRVWERRVGTVDLGDYEQTVRKIESRSRLSFVQRLFRRGDPRYLEYVRLTVGLLAAIRDVSGSEIVVDSSKGAARALALSTVEGVDLRLVHLVRDCRGVLWSGKKRFRKNARAGISKDDGGKNILRTMEIWTVANVITDLLRRRLPRDKSIRLRYEDLIAEPSVELKRIGDLLEMDLETVASAATNGESMTLGHTIAGNRLRMSGAVRLRPDVEWLERLNWREQAACWGLVGWLMKSYGYRWRANLPDSCERSRAA